MSIGAICSENIGYKIREILFYSYGDDDIISSFFLSIFKRYHRPTKEVALALTQVVIGYLMAPVYSGQRLKGLVHGTKCDHRLKDGKWLMLSLQTGNRKLVSCCLLNCMAFYNSVAANNSVAVIV